MRGSNAPVKKRGTWKSEKRRGGASVTNMWRHRIYSSMANRDEKFCMKDAGRFNWEKRRGEIDVG
jgi:hypothetical protein